MTLVEIKTGKITEKGQLVIPKSIRDRFREGTKVAILAYDDKIELRPLDEVDKSLSCAYASEKVLARDWDTQEEDEAWSSL